MAMAVQQGVNVRVDGAHVHRHLLIVEGAEQGAAPAVQLGCVHDRRESDIGRPAVVAFVAGQPGDRVEGAEVGTEQDHDGVSGRHDAGDDGDPPVGPGGAQVVDGAGGQSGGGVGEQSDLGERRFEEGDVERAVQFAAGVVADLGEQFGVGEGKVVAVFVGDAHLHGEGVTLVDVEVDHGGQGVEGDRPGPAVQVEGDRPGDVGERVGHPEGVQPGGPGGRRRDGHSPVWLSAAFCGVDHHTLTVVVVGGAVTASAGGPQIVGMVGTAIPAGEDVVDLAGPAGAAGILQLAGVPVAGQDLGAHMAPGRRPVRVHLLALRRVMLRRPARR